MRLWQIEPTYLTDAFRHFYEESPLNITRILGVAHDLKVRLGLCDIPGALNQSCRYWRTCWKCVLLRASLCIRLGPRIPKLGQVAPGG